MGFNKHAAAGSLCVMKLKVLNLLLHYSYRSVSTPSMHSLYIVASSCVYIEVDMQRPAAHGGPCSATKRL